MLKTPKYGTYFPIKEVAVGATVLLSRDTGRL